MARRWVNDRLLACLLAGTAAAGCSGSDGGPDPVTLEAISVAPHAVTLAAGAAQQFTATAQFSDGGTAAATVTWSATGGTISQSGNYTAGSTPGEYLVIATGQGVTLADTALVTIPAPPPPNLVAIEVTPPSATVQAGLTQQFTAIGRLSDDSPQAVAVTWSATGGTVSAGGIYTAGATPGSYRVIATEIGGPFADTSLVTVTAAPPTLVAIQVAPDSIRIAPYATQQFSAIGILAGGGTTPVTVTWSTTTSTVPGFSPPPNSIAASGLFSAGVPLGRYLVIATHAGSGLADTVPVRVHGTTGQSVPLFPADTLNFWTPEPGIVKLCTSNHYTDDPAGLGGTATVTASAGTVSSPVPYLTRDSVQYADGGGAVKVECRPVWTAPPGLVGTVRVTIAVASNRPGSGMAKIFKYENRNNPQGRADFTPPNQDWSPPNWTIANVAEFVDASLTNGANIWFKSTIVP